MNRPIKRCLVVDDSPVIRRIARRILESLGYEVTEAADGMEAFDRYVETRPNLVLLDWQLPVMTAFEFLSAVRTARLDTKAHILYCTTEQDPLDVHRAMSHGADDVLMKPFVREMLVAKLPDTRHAA
jgi:two-component system chemotaxis response regulator CheY